MTFLTYRAKGRSFYFFTFFFFFLSFFSLLVFFLGKKKLKEEISPIHFDDLLTSYDIYTSIMSSSFLFPPKLVFLVTTIFGICHNLFSFCVLVHLNQLVLTGLSFHRTDGIGLSAPQVGLNVQLLVFNAAGERGIGEELVFINPKVQKLSQKQVLFNEGCLSFPGIYADVEVLMESLMAYFLIELFFFFHVYFLWNKLMEKDRSFYHFLVDKLL